MYSLHLEKCLGIFMKLKYIMSLEMWVAMGRLFSGCLFDKQDYPLK